MRLCGIHAHASVLLALILSYCSVVFSLNVIEDDIIVRYEKKPPAPVHFDNFHQFTRTPFQADKYENFLDTNIDESTGVTFRDLNELNGKLRPVIKELVQENFFRIFRLNLFKECPFWTGGGFCMHRSCAVDTIDDWKDLPEIWQPEALGKLEDSALVNPLNANITQDDNNDYCDLDGFIHNTVFVDLVANPERFTGYGGDQSWQIWKSIYNENCFNLGHDQCIEKNFFYKIISGMHASISTHLSNEYLDKSAMEYIPNLEQFMTRVGNYPDRIANLYLNYMVVLKALTKLEAYGVFDDLHYTEDTNFVEKESEFKSQFKELLDPALEFAKEKNQCMFDESILFKEKNSMVVKEEIRENFKNITRIMDCVHCDRCRLWGKLQTTGYGTSLKTLFELKDKSNFHINLSKMEIIALVNTFDRLSKSLESVEKFKKMYDEAILREERGEHEITTNSLEGLPGQASFISGGSSYDLEAKKKTAMKKASNEKMKMPEVFKKEKKFFEEVIYPKLDKDGDGETLGEIFITELKNVFNSLKWLARSYFIFPKIVYNWCLIRMVYYWNTFIGHVDHDFDFNRLYRIEI